MSMSKTEDNPQTVQILANVGIAYYLDLPDL